MSHEPVLHDLYLQLDEDLTPYGHFLAMRGAQPAEQRIGAPEIILTVGSIIVWCISKYVTAYLTALASERAKKDAHAVADEKAISQKIEDIQRTLSSMVETDRKTLALVETKLAQLLPATGDRPQIVFDVDTEALMDFLERLNLSRRVASKLAAEWAPMLTDAIGRTFHEAQ